jgi:hypothetical protein
VPIAAIGLALAFGLEERPLRAHAEPAQPQEQREPEPVS